MSVLSLRNAVDIIEKSFAYGEHNQLKPLSVAVLDPGGHLLAFQRQDGASMLRFEIAFGKAYGALAVGFGSRWLENASRERPHFVAGLSAVSGGNVVPVPGGVLVYDTNRRLLGAVGITGDTSDNDEAAAVVAVENLGLSAEIG